MNFLVTLPLQRPAVPLHHLVPGQQLADLPGAQQ